ncbi:MAG: hypothetical protein M1832_003611 [Thelocarpon impressellum]|nr:MAG: hypothetical protein M1832_003611 [Thelocarpon impressellum]
MKLSIAAIAAVLAVASAQGLPNIPVCSQACFLDALSSDGCTSITDFKCHCSKPQLVDKITPCVKRGCSESDAAAVTKTVSDKCAEVGAPLAGLASSAAPSSSAASSSSAPAASSAPATSSGAATTKAVSSYLSSATSVAGAAKPTTAPSGNSTSPAPFTGAASQLGASALSGAVALAVAAFYVL